MLTVKQFTFNPLQENTYVIYNEQGWCAIIDPGCYFSAEREALQAFIVEAKLAPKFLLNTHCHLDHIFGNKFVHETYGLSLHLHKLEELVLSYGAASGAKWGLPFENYSGPLVFLEEGDQVKIGEDILDILLTPGHSPGSICFYSKTQNFIISGDVLFKGSVGRTDLPGGDTETLFRSIAEKLLPLPDEVTVYSGHGSATTIGIERRTNPYILHAGL